MRELTPELRALRDLSRAASQGAAGVDELLDRICTTVTETFEFTRTVILRLDDEILVPLASHGVEEGTVPAGLRLADRPLYAAAAEASDAIAGDDGVAVPLMAQGRCMGIIAADRGGETFRVDQPTLDILTTIGAVAGVYLERALETAELRRLNDVARSFVGLASHELRTPAAVVHGIAATLHLRGEELTEQQRWDLRRTLYEQSDRLRLLVDQLLDLSRLEANAIKIHPQRFPVRTRLEELLVMVAAERMVDVELSVEPDLEAWADPDAFDRVVSNLVTNAFRYGKPPVAVEAEQTNGTLRLRVRDHGPGVAPSFVPKLFERFARSEASSASTVGAGLGLSIAQQFAQAQGGELHYRDGQHGGACFELVLPGADVSV